MPGGRCWCPIPRRVVCPPGCERGAWPSAATSGVTMANPRLDLASWFLRRPPLPPYQERQRVQHTLPHGAPSRLPVWPSRSKKKKKKRINEITPPFDLLISYRLVDALFTKESNPFYWPLLTSRGQAGRSLSLYLGLSRDKQGIIFWGKKIPALVLIYSLVQRDRSIFFFEKPVPSGISNVSFFLKNTLLQHIKPSADILISIIK